MRIGATERMLLTEVRTRYLARTVEWHDVLPSTQDRARELALAGGPAGTVVVADRQTAGRGRDGSLWYSPPGGLYASFVLFPTTPVAEAHAITVWAAGALTSVLGLDLGLEPHIKAPNDVLVGGRKVAGILAEAATRAGEPQVEFVCLGIGINITTDLPEQLATFATRLADHLADPPSPVVLLARLAERLEERLEPGRWSGLRPLDPDPGL